MNCEIKFQVFTIKNKTDHCVWQYDSLEEAEKQYDVCSLEEVMRVGNTDKVELQQIIVLRKEVNRK